MPISTFSGICRAARHARDGVVVAKLSSGVSRTRPRLAHVVPSSAFSTAGNIPPYPPCSYSTGFVRLLDQLAVAAVDRILQPDDRAWLLAFRECLDEIEDLGSVARARSAYSACLTSPLRSMMKVERHDALLTAAFQLFSAARRSARRLRPPDRTEAATDSPACRGRRRAPCSRPCSHPTTTVCRRRTESSSSLKSIASSCSPRASRGIEIETTCGCSCTRRGSRYSFRIPNQSPAPVGRLHHYSIFSSHRSTNEPPRRVTDV